jgi:sodium/bile acid cotransporter 7
VRLDPFFIAMLAAIALAAIAPELGARGGTLHLDLVTQIGVALVFFLHGAALSRAALKMGAANWRLHLLVQSTTFILFPVLGAALYLAARPFAPAEVLLGLFYLCALSSTISSSVAMTAMARGDVAGAVFNATLSGLLGMVLTPTLIGLVTAGTQAVPWLTSLGDIALKLFVPFALGHLVRPLIGSFIDSRKAFLSNLDRSVIVLIVYGAFCDSILADMWSRYSPGVLIAVFGAVALLLVVALAFTRSAARRLSLSTEQEVAALFCGSQKSLANGAPMAKILFGSHPALAMIMLPLLMYHQLQLIVCFALARRYAARAVAAPAEKACS